MVSFVWCGRYYKIAVTLSGYRLLARENSGYQNAVSDPFFKSFLPKQSYNGLSLVRPFMTPMKTSLIFQEQSGETSSLKSLFDDEFLSHMPEKIQKFAGEHKVHIASSHGDLHQGNMFEHEGKPTLIDWGGFRSVFWGRYDEIHYHFCRVIAQDGLKLTDVLVYARDVIELLSQHIAFDENDLIAYVLCRSALESDQDRVISKNLYHKRLFKYIYRVQLVWKALQK